MRHFVAYHNTLKMGGTLADFEPLAVDSNKSLKRLKDNVVWIIQGDAGESKSYSLASAFVVSEVGETRRHDFKFFARGEGHVFKPPVRLNELPWFADLFKITGNFGFGPTEVKSEAVIAALTALAADAGWIGAFQKRALAHRFFRTTIAGRRRRPTFAYGFIPEECLDRTRVPLRPATV